jgi:ribosome-associated protein
MTEQTIEKVMQGAGQGGEGTAGNTADSLVLAKRLRDIIEDKKGVDVIILDISRMSSFADFFVNATATNTRMLSTLVDEVGKGIELTGTLPRGIEGRAETGWVLVDGGDVIVNLFLAAERDKYQIEKIWADAQYIED